MKKISKALLEIPTFLNVKSSSPRAHWSLVLSQNLNAQALVMLCYLIAGSCLVGCDFTVLGLEPKGNFRAGRISGINRKHTYIYVYIYIYGHHVMEYCRI